MDTRQRSISRARASVFALRERAVDFSMHQAW